MNNKTFIGEAITNHYEIIFKKCPCHLIDAKHEFASILEFNICKHIKCDVSIIFQFREWKDITHRLHHFVNKTNINYNSK